MHNIFIMFINGANNDEIEIIVRVLDKFKNFEDFISNLTIEVIDRFCDTSSLKIDKFINDGKETCAYSDVKKNTILISNLKHIGIYIKKCNINYDKNTFFEDTIVHEFGHLWFEFLAKNKAGVRDILRVELQGLNNSQAYNEKKFIHEIFAITFQKKLHSSNRGLNMQLSDKILFETKKRLKESQRLLDDNPGYFVRMDTKGEFTLHKADNV